MKINWPAKDLEQPYDLCTQINGVYADVIQSVTGWYCLWDGQLRSKEFLTRAEAIEWFDCNIDDLKRGKIPQDTEMTG